MNCLAETAADEVLAVFVKTQMGYCSCSAASVNLANPLAVFCTVKID